MIRFQQHFHCFGIGTAVNGLVLQPCLAYQFACKFEVVPLYGFTLPTIGRLTDDVVMDTVRLYTPHFNMPSSSLPMLNVAVAVGEAGVEFMLSELTSSVIFGPALVLIDFTSDNADASPQRLTAFMPT